MNILIFAIIIIAAVVLYLWYIYNDLITMRLRVKEAWSQIDVQLKRRVDLIPNLVETVKGYAKHEKRVLETITQARASLLSAKTPKEKAQADNHLVSALKTLFAVAENYPNLKASENFLTLQRQLEDTEDKVSYARQFYNNVVLDYNTKLQLFPNIYIAGYFRFKEEQFFAANEEEKKNIRVKFE